MSRSGLGKPTVLGILGLLASVPMHGAGFGIFEHGSKAMGMAGAFTAQADDPSAIFHNAAGVAFFDEREWMIGTTYISSSEAKFKGENPFPGEGVTAEQNKLSEFPSHLYVVQPLNDTWKAGLGLFTPFGLTTDWKNPDGFAGRGISTHAALRTFDLNPTLAWKPTPNFGIGFGADILFSDVKLDRRNFAINPFTLAPADVAKVHLESDLDRGYGWNVGLLHKFNNSFSWGLSYRSKIKVKYEGDATLTQNPTGFAQFDAAVRAAIPFGTKLPVKTEIEFPDLASLGLMVAINPAMKLEVDVNWTGWSSFDTLEINFTSSDPTKRLPNSVVRESWKDEFNYRIGFDWMLTQSESLRLGFVYDKTPQPDQSVSPLLPDADRKGITVGWGHRGAIRFDTALMYLPFGERTTHSNYDNFNGTYKTTAWLLGVSLGF